MKKGIRFNRLVLVDGRGREAADDSALEYGYREDAAASGAPSGDVRNTLLVLVAVSFACTAAAVATGSYALWLSRQSASRQALTDVGDLLRTCQTRMEQLETDYRSLPTQQ